MRDLLAEIDAEHPGLMERFGGHARAAGLSLPAAHLAPFRDAFDRYVSNLRFGAEQVWSDGALSGAQLALETAEAIDAAGPWGQGWEEPLFDGRFRVLERRVVGADHLKLVLAPVEGGAPLDAIAFRAGALCHRDLPDPLHVTYRLSINRWRGNVDLQLMLQHLVDDIAEPD
jgi:single-stranded-DNA-specific exonuclease